MPKAPSVNRSYDVPYLAGMSKDGSTIYIDRNLPHQIDVGGKKFDPALSLGLHELTEYRAMEGAGMKWEPAHKRLANVAERRWLQSRGVDWRHYEEIMDGYLSHMEREKIDNPPPDLYIKPYPADMRHKLVTHGVAKAEGGEVGGNPLESSFEAENVPAAQVSPKPGKTYGQLGGNTINQNRIETLSRNAETILKSDDVRNLVKKHFGISNYEITPVLGTWENEPEPSFSITGKNMRPTMARNLASFFGLGMWQDAAVHTMHHPQVDLDSGTPTVLLGHGDVLTPKERRNILSAASKHGRDLTFTRDGKAAKFSYFGDENGYTEFGDDIDNIRRKSKMPEVLVVRTKGELTNAEDYLKKIMGGTRQREGMEGSSGQPSDLFRGLVDHILTPFTKAAKEEGYRFSPQKFSEFHGLTDAERGYLLNSLVPHERKPPQGVGFGRPTVTEDVGYEYPGIYGDPRPLVAEAASRVAPESPNLKKLFGVTRADLYEIGKNRVGNMEPTLAMSPNPRGSIATQGIMNPQNEQRLIDILNEAGKYQGLRHGMDAWYVMDPFFQLLSKKFGFEKAKQIFKTQNTLTGMASPGSEVPTEINRGMAAYYMHMQNRFPEFVEHGGKSAEGRGADFPTEIADVMGHPYHSTSQAGPMQRFLQSGKVEMGTPKVPTYIPASGVPETGFQTTHAVPDAHYTRIIGMADTRRSMDPGVSMKMPEYQQVQPWWKQNIAEKVGLQAVPAQARIWGAGSGATGVTSPIGAPKLEMLADYIAGRAQKHDIPIKQAFEDIFAGRRYAAGGFIPQYAEGDVRARGGIVDLALSKVRPFASGGSVYMPSFAQGGDVGIGHNQGPPIEEAPNRKLSQLGLYSHGAEVASNLPQEKGSPQQMVAMLKKNGVKPAELQNANLTDEQGNVHPDWASRGSVTKDELSQHLEKSRPPLEENLYGNSASEKLDSARYADKTLPGGENYREVVVHLPVKKSLPLEEAASRFNNSSRQATDAMAEWKRIDEENSPGFPGTLDAYSKVNKTRNARREDEEAFKKLQKEWSDSQYHGAHHGVVNTVGHIRMSDRYGNGTTYSTSSRQQVNSMVEQQKRDLAALQQHPGRYSSDPLEAQDYSQRAKVLTDRLEKNKKALGEYEKILHVEELQSDMAQEGRREGFLTPEKRTQLLKQSREAEERVDVLNKRLNELALDRHPVTNRINDEKGWHELSRQRDKEFKASRDPHIALANGVPPAPYVTNTSGWTRLLLKRVLKEAVDGGYDRIAFTPGEAQANRYGLEHQVDHLLYKKNPDGTYQVSAQTPGGRGISVGKSIPEDKLERHIGKEIAERMAQGIGDKVRMGWLSPPDVDGRPDLSAASVEDIWHKLHGKDLKVGGEKMKAYYDKIAMNELNDLLKSMGNNGRVNLHHTPLVPDPYADLDTRVKGKPVMGHSLKVTPELIRDVNNGMPDFASGGIVEGNSTPTHGSVWHKNDMRRK